MKPQIYYVLKSLGFLFSNHLIQSAKPQNNTKYYSLVEMSEVENIIQIMNMRKIP